MLGKRTLVYHKSDMCLDKAEDFYLRFIGSSEV